MVLFYGIAKSDNLKTTGFWFKSTEYLPLSQYTFTC